MLIVLSQCNWVPVAGISLAPAWTLDLQINSHGKSSKTENNLFSNKPLERQLISTVGVRKVQLSDWNRKHGSGTQSSLLFLPDLAEQLTSLGTYRP